MKINGKKFPVYKLDTKNSILERIASDMKTTKEYLFFPDHDWPEGEPKDQSWSGHFTVENLLEKIKKDAEKNTDFSGFFRSLAFPAESKQARKILKIWLAYNKTMENLSKINPIVLTEFSKNLSEYMDEDEFIKFWKTERLSILTTLENDIKYESLMSSKYTEIYKTFEENEGLVYTDLHTLEILLEITINLKHITLLEIFNNIILNSQSPFSFCKKYYKILKDFIPPEEWGDYGVFKKVCAYSGCKRQAFYAKKGTNNVRFCSLHAKLQKNYINVIDEQIVVKVNRKEENEPEDYSNAIIIATDTSVVANLDIITRKHYLSQENYINRFLKILNNPEYNNVKETSVKGIFIFPQARIDTYVFADLTMINPLFSTMINIDERLRTTKKKTENSQPWLRIHFDHPNSGHISASIIQKLVDRSDILIREEDPNGEIFKQGEPYIRVSVKGKDKKAIIFFQELLSKLLVIYNDNYNDIVKIYKKYIPAFGTITEVVQASKKKAIDLIAPDLFIKNYSRRCPADKMPSIIGKEEALELLEKKETKDKVMLFPRGIQVDSANSFPSDGKNQNYYVCNNPKFPYPGLQVNKLANSGDYPFAPCCFMTNQAVKPGSAYNKYYSNQVLEVKDKKQQELITTNKILNPDKYGILPLELQKIFDLVDTDINYKYIRVGVSRDYNSFLNSIITATKTKTTRSKLAKEENAIMSKQCLYDNSIENIMKNIKNNEVYLDPKLYCQLLEGYFNCNIFIFSRSGPVIPRHTQGYYKQNRKGVSVFIYEHLGSESDNVKYPQCELIVKWNVKKSVDVQYSFQYENKVSRSVKKIYEMLGESYTLGTKITNTVFNLCGLDGSGLEVSSQVIDSYGKCRRVDLSSSITLFTDPMAPLNVKETREDPKLTSFDTAYAFLEKYGKVLSQTVDGVVREVNGVVREVNGIIGNVRVSIPLAPNPGSIHPSPATRDSVGAGITKNIGMLDLPITHELHYNNENISSLDLYNKNKKIARYLTEYIFWLFSGYIKDEKISEITDKVLVKFAKHYTVIIENFQYGNVNKLFSRKDDSLMKDGKLVVDSEDMLKRLMYVLKLYSVRDLDSLLNYHNREFIVHYYLDITDFDNIPSQVILQGENSVDKWIRESRFTYDLQKGIIIGRNSPYFFSNRLVGKEVYIAQNVKSIDKALEVSKIWKTDGYIEDERYLTGEKGGTGEEKEIVESFTLYSYINEDDITPYIITGKDSTPISSMAIILGYKLSGYPFYTVLLEI